MATLICEKRGRKKAARDPSDPRGGRKRELARALPVRAEHPDTQLHPLEAEWDAMLKEDTLVEAELAVQTAKASQEVLASLTKRLEACRGKRWLLAEVRELEAAIAKERARPPASARDASLLQPYKAALRGLHAGGAAYAGMRPSRMARAGYGSAATPTVDLTASAGARKDGTRKPEVLLMTPENASRALTLHLQSQLRRAPPPMLLTVGDICDECGVQMKVIANDSMLGCSSCHKTRLLPNTTTMNVSSTGEFDYSSSVIHQKHRLPEWIEMAQAKEFLEPTPDVLESVAEHLIREGRTGLSASDIRAVRREREARGPFANAEEAVYRLREAVPHISSAMQSAHSGSVRVALREIVQAGGPAKLRKYYEHSAKCAAYVSGYWPPRMNAQQEEILRLMYSVAAPAYEARRKPTQQYWPGGFPYFLRSACALLGWDEFVPLFPLPSGSKEGGVRHEMRKAIWEGDLHWEMVPAYAPLPPIRVRSGAGSAHYEVFQLLEDSVQEECVEEPVYAAKRRKVE